MTPVDIEHIAKARVTTPKLTFVKHTFDLRDGVARVAREGNDLAVLTVAEATVHMGVHRVAGLNEQGEPTVWKVDNLGCGCRDQVRVFATDEMYVPT